MRRTLLSLLLFVHAACASQTRVPEATRIAVEARHAGRTVELRQSCYFGDLYDDNEKWLLSPYPFAESSHIVDLDGAPIHPKNQRGIVPAGTPFIIKRVEFPDLHAMSMRMLTTPRYNPWLYLSPAPGAAGLPTERPTFILLLPMDMETEAEVETAIAAAVAPADEVSAWLAARTPAIQVAIKHKEIAPGMSEAELVAAAGAPRRWFNDQEGELNARVAWYESREAWLVDGVVREVRPARRAERTPLPLPANLPPAPTAPDGQPPATPPPPPAAAAPVTTPAAPPTPPPAASPTSP